MLLFLQNNGPLSLEERSTVQNLRLPGVVCAHSNSISLVSTQGALMDCWRALSLYQMIAIALLPSKKPCSNFLASDFRALLPFTSEHFLQF
jgi:hypothetical protein